MRFISVLELFTLFDPYPVQYLLENMFGTLNKINIIELKILFSFTFKV